MAIETNTHCENKQTRLMIPSCLTAPIQAMLGCPQLVAQTDGVGVEGMHCFAGSTNLAKRDNRQMARVGGNEIILPKQNLRRRDALLPQRVSSSNTLIKKLYLLIRVWELKAKKRIKGPESMADYDSYILNMTLKLKELEQSLCNIREQERSLILKIDELEEDMRKWSELITMALAEGRDSKAEEYARKLIVVKHALTQFLDLYEEFKANIAEIEKVVSIFTAKVEQTELERERIVRMLMLADEMNATVAKIRTLEDLQRGDGRYLGRLRDKAELELGVAYNRLELRQESLERQKMIEELVREQLPNLMAGFRAQLTDGREKSEAVASIP